MLIANYSFTTDVVNSATTVEDDLRYQTLYNGSTSYTGEFSNGISITTLMYKCCLPADRFGNSLGQYDGSKWEIQLGLYAASCPDNVNVISINSGTEYVYIGTQASAPNDRTVVIPKDQFTSTWKRYIIQCNGSNITIYNNGNKVGTINHTFKFPITEQRNVVGAAYDLDSAILVNAGNTEFHVQDFKVYVDENTTIGQNDEPITPPTPPPTGAADNLVANFPLTQNGNNIVTTVDKTYDLNVTSSFDGNFGKGYFSGTNCTISMNRPYVDNYTNRYLGMPWEIDFQAYIPNCPLYATILTIHNPSSNSNKDRTMSLTTNQKPANPYEICVPTEVFGDGWIDCKIQCTGTGGELMFFANGQQYGNTVRGFILTSDLGTNPSVITFVNNGVVLNLANIYIYLDTTTTTTRGQSEYYMDIGFKVKEKLVEGIPLVVDIPFPYPQFTEMEFFLTDNFGNFIPSEYYERIDENRLYFNPTNVTSLNISTTDEIRFTFVHNRGMYAINKLEYNTKTVKDKYDYELPSPYLKLLDLNMRYRVFYDRKLLFGDQAYEYKIDKYTGIISFDREDFTIEPNKNLDILIFYDGTKYNGAIPYLPMSGYIYFKKHEIDRNYNKDLCCFFVNGRLVHRDNIIKMSNNVYKISKDIQSRYNLEAFSMSPKISELIPFYKKAGRKNTIPDQYIYKEMEVMFTVPRDNYGQKHNRKKLKPVTFNIITVPHYVLPNHKDWYITLVQHGVDEGEFYPDRQISYSAEFFRDDYINISEDINVIGQIRLQGNFEEHTPDSPTALLLGTIPKRVTTCISDTVIFSVKAQTIYDADTTNHNKDIDGVLVRFEIEPFLKKHERPSIYYEMECTEYEKDNYINVFELLVTDQADGEGQEYYKKVINMFPDNNPYENR